MTDTTIRERLKLFRTSLGLTQTEFGKACGISQKTYGNLESGRTKKISSDYLNQIESAFKKLSPNWLRRGAGDMLRQPVAQLPSPAPPAEEAQPHLHSGPIMLAIPDVSHLSPEEQVEYWFARWHKLAIQAAERQAADEHEETVKLVMSAGGKSFTEASSEAADQEEERPIMKAETNPNFTEVPQWQEGRKLGFQFGS